MNNVENVENVVSTNSQLEQGVSQAPIACQLSSSEQAARKEEVGNLLYLSKQARELEDGCEFSYPATEEWANRLVACIAIERECCPFFTFEMIFEKNRGPLLLRLRGPGEVKEFIKAALLPPDISTKDGEQATA